MRWGVVLMVPILMTACAREPSPGAESPPESRPAPGPSTPVPSPDSRGSAGTATSELPDIRLSLSADPAAPGAGRPVTLTLRLEARRDLTLRFPTGQRYDFEAEGPTGTWRWSGGRFFTQALGEMRLRSGEQLSYQEVWVPETAGHHLIRGRVTAAGRPELGVEAGIEVSA